MIFLLLGCPKPTPPVDSDVWQPAATDTGPTSLDDELEPILESHDLPSLAGAILDGAEVTHLGAVGLRSLGTDTAVTPDDRYHLGSCTKAMTATLTAALVEAGKVTWDTTLAEAFPDITVHADYQSVTLEMLLSHTGGAWSLLADHPDTWDALWIEGDVVEQRAWFAVQVLTEAPEVPPGTEYLYSNSGYMLVGAALEALTGESWESLMQQWVFTPLNMTSCGFGAPDSDGSLAQPWGHTDQGVPVDGSSASADNPPALGPAGTVHCSMTDWGAFVAAHLAGARGESTWLSTDSFTRLHTPVLADYALGWNVLSRSWAGDLPALMHTGTNTMFFSNVWIAPSLDMAWLVATNQGDTFTATDETVAALLGL